MHETTRLLVHTPSGLAQVLGVAHARAAVLSNGRLLEVYSPNVEGSLIALSDVLGVETAADMLAFHPQVIRSSFYAAPAVAAEGPSASLVVGWDD